MKNADKGFVFAELLVSTMIFVLLTTAVFVVFISANLSWQLTSQQANLQSNASVLMQKMVRGIDGKHGIMEATTITLPSASQINFTSGIDLKTRSFYLSGGNAYYDPDTGTGSDEIAVCEDVNGMAFTYSSNVVGITLTLQKTVRSKLLSAVFKTDIYKRN